MSKLRRLGLAAMAAVLVVGLGWSARGTAEADALSDAKTQLAQDQQEQSELAEQYDVVLAQQSAAQAKLDQTKSDIAAQTDRVEDLRSQVGVIALQQFQDKGIGTTLALLSAANLTDVLNDFVTTSMVAGITDAVLRDFQLQQAVLTDLQSSQEALVATIDDQTAQLKALKDAADAKVQDQLNLVARLTAAQQAALAGQYTPGNPGSYSPPPPVQNGAAAAQIVAWAYARVGGRYVYGGAGPSSYDCSGFTMMAYASVGIRLPHSAGAQFRLGVPVAPADLEPGDLVFFYSGPGHVGIYVGGGMMIDARSTALGIVYRPFNPGSPFVGARRLL